MEIMENIEFEEKVDIDDLVLTPKPMKLSEIDINDVKKEPQEEEKQNASFDSDHNVRKRFKLNMEENILKLYEDLDKERSESSTLDLNVRRLLKIRQFVEEIAQHESVNYQMKSEIVSLKAKIVEITNEQEIALSRNAETMDKKIKELANNKQELQSVKVTNEELLQKIQELKLNKKTRIQEIKPFSCKYCNKSFFEVHEVKEHIKIHNPISEVEDLRNQVKSLKSQVEELDLKLKNSQTKLPSQTKKYVKPKITTTGTDSKFDGKKKDFECTTCHVGFTNNSNLKRHVSYVHEDGKPKRHSCPKCGKSFRTKEYVKEHVEVVHEGKKPFKCDYCDVCFGRKSDRKSHVTFKHKNVSTK